MKRVRNLYAYMVSFRTADQLLEAARQVQKEGYEKFDAYSPYAIDELSPLIRSRACFLPPLTLAGGLFGLAAGFLLQYFASAVWYPQNVGGKPLNSIPAFVPISFETTVLFASLTCFGLILWFLGYPEPYHPVFHMEGFERASQDRFFLAIESEDPKFDPKATRDFLNQLGAEDFYEVPH